MALAQSAQQRGALERETSTLAITQIAAYLQQLLGQRLVAYLSGLNDPKMVGKWMQGKAQPSEDKKMRLRYAYTVAKLFDSAYGPETTKAWLFGTNSQLDDDAPARVLRHGKSIDDLHPVYVAARTFLGDA